MCCSASGWCGTSEKHCGVGCNKDFGKCSVADANGLCGPKNGGAKCPNNECCSVHGFCGKEPAYCTVGCQKEYGTCTIYDEPTAVAKGLCGPMYANAKCLNDKCCSKEGVCGTDPEHCGPFNCLGEFGKCDELAKQTDAPIGPRKAIMMQSKKANGEKEWYTPALEQKHVAFFKSIGYEDASYVEYTTRAAFIALMKTHVSVPQDGKFHHRWLSLDAHGENNNATEGSSTIAMWAGDTSSYFTTEDLRKIIFDITPSNCILMCLFYNCQNENLAYGFYNFEALAKHVIKQQDHMLYKLGKMPIGTPPVEDPGPAEPRGGAPLYGDKNIIIFTTANKDQNATDLGGDSLLGIIRDTYEESKHGFMGTWVEMIESGLPDSIRTNYSAHVSKLLLYYMKPFRFMQNWSTDVDRLGYQA
jgi:hypothetical protein